MGAQRATFDVTLSAQVTKSWAYRVTRQEAACTVSSHVQGRRTVSIRSTKPTIVRVTLDRGRIRFAPSLVRNVVAVVTPRGTVTRQESGPNECPRRTTRTTCLTRAARSAPTQVARFYLSGKNEISFRPMPDYGAAGGCPPEAADVRAERPGVHEAQGELSIDDLFSRRFRFQTAIGSFEQTTELYGDPPGKVVARVSWSLKFARR